MRFLHCRQKQRNISSCHAMLDNLVSKFGPSECALQALLVRTYFAIASGGAFVYFVVPNSRYVTFAFPGEHHDFHDLLSLIV
jgi:hypothetical protein